MVRRKSRIELPTIIGIFGVIVTAIIYMMFNDGLVPMSYLGDFALNQLCAFNLIIFSIIALIVGIGK